MKNLIYVDSSAALNILFRQGEYLNLKKIIENSTRVFSVSLLEAEVLAAFHREKLDLRKAESFFQKIEWVRPTRSLGYEFSKIFSHSYIKGADAHHLAAALYLDPSAKLLHFLSTDKQQANLAKKLGFFVN